MYGTSITMSRRYREYMMRKYHSQYRRLPGIRYDSNLVDSMPWDNTDLIGGCISRAAKHAWSVGRREHIKADRHERVGQFMVSLRSVIIEACGVYKIDMRIQDGLIYGLCQKRLWHDAGRLSDDYSMMSKGTYQKLREIVMSIDPMSFAEPEKEKIRRGLSALAVEVGLCRETATKVAQKINDKADKVVGDLADLMEKSFQHF